MSYHTVFYKIVHDITKSFKIRDLVQPSNTVIFLLESPHIQEIQAGVPVAGKSGQSMRKHLFGDQYGQIPLGPLLSQAQQTTTDAASHDAPLNKIGLMNVSQIPLQKTAYRLDKTGHPFSPDPNLTSWFEDMELVRTSNHKLQYQNPRHQAIQDVLITDLRSRLQALSSPLTIIPCGKFAQKFLKLADTAAAPHHVIWDVPHPSYNSWDRAMYREVIEQVKAAVR